MTPLDYYQQQLAQGLIVADPQQQTVIELMQTVYFDLCQEYKKRQQLLAFVRKPKQVKGLYLWGGVGIGKTFMMDCFYHCLPFKEKMRIHFHAFMKMIHVELRKYQGEKNPLNLIADKISKENLVICFDEFFVNDITDAMILAQLFKALFSRGVCLVATSNTEPDELYKRGLQRKQFLPAIALIKAGTTVFHVSTKIDYRLRHLKDAGVFYPASDSSSHLHMEKSFEILANGHEVDTNPIEIYGRLINIKKRSNDVIWFDFHELCRVPRSQLDYLAITEQYNTVLVSDIPIISPNAKDTISLFIRLIDVLYDARTRLIFSAAAPVDKLYDQGYLAADFIRTRSRLIEMQSEEYFTQGLGSLTSST